MDTPVVKCEIAQEELMREYYPRLRSFMIGGMNWDYYLPMEYRLEKIYEHACCAIQMAGFAGTGITGDPHREIKASPAKWLERYLQHGTHRNDHKTWVKLCKRLEIVPDEWRTTRPVYTPLEKWEEFRAALKPFLARKLRYEEAINDLAKNHAE